MSEELKEYRESKPSVGMAEFKRHVGQLNLRGTRVVCVLGATMVPAFAVLDYFILSQFFHVLLVTRLTVAVFCIGIVVATYAKSAQRWASLLSGVALVVVALMIAVMVHLHDWAMPDKSPSNYYAGLMLVSVAATLLCTWTLKESLVVFSIIYLSYLVPTLVIQPPADGIMYMANNLFLSSTIIVSIVGHYFSHNLKMREFFATNELEKAISDLGQANEKLKEMDRFKSQFFSNITHELKTPLTLILAPAEAVLNDEMGTFDPDQLAIFRRIHFNGLKLMKLINDLLDLAKLEDSKLKLRVQEADLLEFMSGLISNLKPLADRKKITLVMADVNAPIKLWFDRDCMERVLINLLANAVKFTPENGRIDVAIKEEGDKVNIIVADTGIGIPTDKLDLVFDRFSQVDGTVTRRFGGTGIGLALAKELTQLHGGRIWAESVERRGTRMSVELRKGNEHFDPKVLDRRVRRATVPQGRRHDDQSLPAWSARLEENPDYKFLAVDEATERRLAPREAAHLDKVKPKVLIVEDSREMLQFLHLQLRKKYSVYLAEDGVKGWDMVKKIRPDLVLTDYMMPEMDGLTLTSYIKNGKETAHIPVVMLTAKASIGDKVAGKEAGADEYLAKPFSTSELLAVVEALIKAGEEEADRLVLHRMDSVDIIAARLAHEIHNPVNYLLNGSSMAKKSLKRLLDGIAAGEGEFPAEKRAQTAQRLNRLLDQITVGAERISGTVKVLREYAREGYTRVERPYDVDEGINAVLQMVKPVDDVQREVRFNPAGAGLIKVVPQEFHEIVSNLVQNALDATGSDNIVTVTTTGSPDDVLLLVEDDGEGIPTDVVDKIFSPFFTTKEPGRGMGMGLTIVYRLVKKYDGKIDVQSRVGGGTRFSVRLPRQLGTPEPAQTEGES